MESFRAIKVTLNRYPAYSLRIEGHTDSDGSDPANQILVEGGAKSCYDYRLNKGELATRMSQGVSPSPVMIQRMVNAKTDGRTLNYI